MIRASSLALSSISNKCSNFATSSNDISNESSFSTSNLNKCDCVKCTYCLNNLSSVSVKCSECTHFHLCLKCFSMSAEIGEHKKDHNYYLNSSISFPIFDSEKLWTFKEEVLLLQFIEQYGFGNWEEIAKHLSTRTADECMQHYHSYYIFGNLGKYTFGANLKLSNQLSSLEQSCDTLSTLSLQSNSTTTNSGLTSGFAKPLLNSNELATTVLLPPIEMSLEEQRALGYMPLRDDFEREYKNDAEVLLSNLTIANNQLALINGLMTNKTPSTSISSTCSVISNQILVNNVGYSTSANLNSSLSNLNNLDNDDLIDFDLKLTFIQMYRECLNERQRFKKIAREYGLINNASSLLNKHNSTNNNLNNKNQSISLTNSDNLSNIGKKKKCLDSDKEINNLNEKLKKYTQFMTVSDYETLLDNLRKQTKLYKRIQELQYYRSQLGLTKLNDIDKYSKEKSLVNLKKEKFEPTVLTTTPKEKRKKSLQGTSSLTTPTTITTKRFTRRNQSPNDLISLQPSPKKQAISRVSLESSLNELNSSIIKHSNVNCNSDSSVSNSTRSSRSRTNSNNSITNDATNSENLKNETLTKIENDSLNLDENDENLSVENFNVNKTDDLISDSKLANKYDSEQEENLFMDSSGNNSNDSNDDDIDHHRHHHHQNNYEESIAVFANEDLSEDLSSGDPASSGGSGINELNHNDNGSNVTIGRRLRQLSNRRTIQDRLNNLNISTSSTSKTKILNHSNSNMKSNEKKNKKNLKL